MTKEINALDLRKHFGEVMEAVRYGKEPYIVKRNGRPMIVLLDIDVYKSSKSRLQEEAFIEEYSDERVVEFLKEDYISRVVRKRARKILGA